MAFEYKVHLNVLKAIQNKPKTIDTILEEVSFRMKKSVTRLRPHIYNFLKEDYADGFILRSERGKFLLIDNHTEGDDFEKEFDDLGYENIAELKVCSSDEEEDDGEVGVKSGSVGLEVDYNVLLKAISEDMQRKTKTGRAKKQPKNVEKEIWNKRPRHIDFVKKNDLKLQQFTYGKYVRHELKNCNAFGNKPCVRPETRLKPATRPDLGARAVGGKQQRKVVPSIKTDVVQMEVRNEAKPKPKQKLATPNYPKENQKAKLGKRAFPGMREIENEFKDRSPLKRRRIDFGIGKDIDSKAFLGQLLVPYQGGMKLHNGGRLNQKSFCFMVKIPGFIPPPLAQRRIAQTLARLARKESAVPKAPKYLDGIQTDKILEPCRNARRRHKCTGNLFQGNRYHFRAGGATASCSFLSPRASVRNPIGIRANPWKRVQYNAVSRMDRRIPVTVRTVHKRVHARRGGGAAVSGLRETYTKAASEPSFSRRYSEVSVKKPVKNLKKNENIARIRGSEHLKRKPKANKVPKSPAKKVYSSRRNINTITRDENEERGKNALQSENNAPKPRPTGAKVLAEGTESSKEHNQANKLQEIIEARKTYANNPVPDGAIVKSPEMQLPTLSHQRNNVNDQQGNMRNDGQPQAETPINQKMSEKLYPKRSWKRNRFASDSQNYPIGPNVCAKDFPTNQSFKPSKISHGSMPFKGYQESDKAHAKDGPTSQTAQGTVTVADDKAMDLKIQQVVSNSALSTGTILSSNIEDGPASESTETLAQRKEKSCSTTQAEVKESQTNDLPTLSAQMKATLAKISRGRTLRSSHACSSLRSNRLSRYQSLSKKVSTSKEYRSQQGNLRKKSTNKNLECLDANSKKGKFLDEGDSDASEAPCTSFLDKHLSNRQKEKQILKCSKHNNQKVSLSSRSIRKLSSLFDRKLRELRDSSRELAQYRRSSKRLEGPKVQGNSGTKSKADQKDAKAECIEKLIISATSLGTSSIGRDGFNQTSSYSMATSKGVCLNAAEAEKGSCRSMNSLISSQSKGGQSLQSEQSSQPEITASNKTFGSGGTATSNLSGISLISGQDSFNATSAMSGEVLEITRLSWETNTKRASDVLMEETIVMGQNCKSLMKGIHGKHSEFAKSSKAHTVAIVSSTSSTSSSYSYSSSSSFSIRTDLVTKRVASQLAAYKKRKSLERQKRYQSMPPKTKGRRSIRVVPAYSNIRQRVPYSKITTSVAQNANQTLAKEKSHSCLLMKSTELPRIEGVDVKANNELSREMPNESSLREGIEDSLTNRTILEGFLSSMDNQSICRSSGSLYSTSARSSTYQSSADNELTTDNDSLSTVKRSEVNRCSIGAFHKDFRNSRTMQEQARALKGTHMKHSLLKLSSKLETKSLDRISSHHNTKHSVKSFPNEIGEPLFLLREERVKALQNLVGNTASKVLLIEEILEEVEIKDSSKLEARKLSSGVQPDTTSTSGVTVESQVSRISMEAKHSRTSKNRGSKQSISISIDLDDKPETRKSFNEGKEILPVHKEDSKSGQIRAQLDLEENEKLENSSKGPLIDSNKETETKSSLELSETIPKQKSFILPQQNQVSTEELAGSASENSFSNANELRETSAKVDVCLTEVNGLRQKAIALSSMYSYPMIPVEKNESVQEFLAELEKKVSSLSAAIPIKTDKSKISLNQEPAVPVEMSSLNHFIEPTNEGALEDVQNSASVEAVRSPQTDLQEGLSGADQSSRISSSSADVSSDHVSCGISSDARLSSDLLKKSSTPSGKFEREPSAMRDNELSSTISVEKITMKLSTHRSLSKTTETSLEKKNSKLELDSGNSGVLGKKASCDTEATNHPPKPNQSKSNVSNSKNSQKANVESAELNTDQSAVSISATSEHIITKMVVPTVKTAEIGTSTADEPFHDDILSPYVRPEPNENVGFDKARNSNLALSNPNSLRLAEEAFVCDSAYFPMSVVCPTADYETNPILASRQLSCIIDSSPDSSREHIPEVID